MMSNVVAVAEAAALAALWILIFVFVAVLAYGSVSLHYTLSTYLRAVAICMYALAIVWLCIEIRSAPTHKLYDWALLTALCFLSARLLFEMYTRSRVVV